MEVTRSEKEDSTKNQKRFRKVNSRRDPEGEALDDDHDSRVLAAIANQEVLYEGGKTSVSAKPSPGRIRSNNWRLR